MSKTLILKESAYCENGKKFEDILKNSIEDYVKNIYCYSGQNSKNFVKSK